MSTSQSSPSASPLTRAAVLTAILTVLYPLSTVVAGVVHVAVTRFDQFGVYGCVVGAFAGLGWYAVLNYALEMISSTYRGARAALIGRLRDGSQPRGGLVVSAVIIVIGTSAMVATAYLLAQSRGFATGWVMFLGAGVVLQLFWAVMALCLVAGVLRGARRDSGAAGPAATTA